MLRQLTIDDMDSAAVVLRTSFDAALPTLAGLHTPDEDRWFFRNRLFATCQLWGYFDAHQMLGFVAFRDGWIDQLYVLPSSQRRGVGTALLQVAQSQSAHLHLWTFQRNTNARRFYEKHHFKLVEQTDGARNEEKEPDALYAWQPDTATRVVDAGDAAAVKLDGAPMSDIIQALTDGRVTASALTEAYLARIAAYDRAGPMLNSVREINPDALAIAGRLDATRPSVEQPLAGVPILVKDNIATGDKQPTTAGSLALQGARARDDATVVKLLRNAGAVILGKTNLTEFANMLAVDMPAGYSSLGGQVKNPYAPTLVDERGIPVVLPGGSSAGSAVAVAAGLCAASIGSETSGSLLYPASQNGLVTVKPTVGLISRAGILPISHSQDTAGPMTRTVRDAALLLNVLAAQDPLDPATRLQQRPADYTDGLAADAMKGARIGVPSDPTDPLNDRYYGKLRPDWAKVMAEAIKVLEDLGAVIVRANMPTAGWIGGPGTTMAVLNRNPLSRTKGNPVTPPIVFLYELKHDLNLYLRDWAANTAIKTMADIVAFNAAHADKALRFGQDLFLAADLTRGDLSEPEYTSARAMDLLAAKTRGMDAYMNQHRLDAVLFPGSTGAAIAAKAGYPSVMVPAGFISGIDDRDTPDYPLGVTFAGPAWSEHRLLRLAYAFEQACPMRRPPPGLPAP